MNISLRHLDNAKLYLRQLIVFFDLTNHTEQLSHHNQHKNNDANC